MHLMIKIYRITVKITLVFSPFLVAKLLIILNSHFNQNKSNYVHKYQDGKKRGNVDVPLFETTL